jgi:hypothetical protein
VHSLAIMSKFTKCIDTRAAFDLPIFLALECRQIPIIFTYLSVQNICSVDIAMSSYYMRKQWLFILKSISCKAIDLWLHSHSSMRWVILRNIRVSQFFADWGQSDKISDLTFEAARINGGRTLSGEEIKGESISLIWEQGKYLKSIYLSGCQGITDAGLSALCYGCSQLQVIFLSSCDGITDISLSALGHRCGQLKDISLTGCVRITDVGVSALVHGCSQLMSINLTGCQGITDICLSAVGHGCSQLLSIDLAGCQGITDVGLLSLVSGCGRLQVARINGCQGITDIGLSALRVKGVKQC